MFSLNTCINIFLICFLPEGASELSGSLSKEAVGIYTQFRLISGGVEYSAEEVYEFDRTWVLNWFPARLSLSLLLFFLLLPLFLLLFFLLLPLPTYSPPYLSFSLLISLSPL